MKTPFVGYVETSGKAPKVKWKDPSNWLTFEEAEQCEGYSGVIAEGFVLLDFDDLEQSEKAMDIVEENLLECMSVITTRGRHFYFKNCGIEKGGTNVRLACGLHADIKVGGKGLGCLKRDGETRDVDWDSGTFQELPCYFRPFKSNIDVIDLKEGEGRNEAYSRYKFAMITGGIPERDALETLNIINDFIVSDPLPQRELTTVLRHEDIPQGNFFEDGKFQHDRFGDFLISQYNIVSINNNLHIYRDGVYVPDESDIERKMLKHIKALKMRDRNETMRYIGLSAPQEQVCGNVNLIAFNNCLYDLETRSKVEFSPEIVITNKIPWDYNPNAHSEAVDTVLGNISCGDSEIKSLLEECIGYCFYRNNEFSKAFILLGDGSNGKSTYLEMIEHILGDQNRAALSLKELSSKFKGAEIFGKLANIGDDISNDFLQGDETSQFKKIVTGSSVTVERKGQDPFSFKPYVKLLFSLNELPRMKDRSNGLMRRLMIIPFNARFDKSNGDFNRSIGRELKKRESIEYAIMLGISGLHRLIDNDGFTESEAVETALAAYEEDNNSVVAFVKEDGKIDEGTPKEVYLRYEIWCDEMRVKPMGSRVFSNVLKSRFGYVSTVVRSDGKVTRRYIIA